MCEAVCLGQSVWDRVCEAECVRQCVWGRVCGTECVRQGVWGMVWVRVREAPPIVSKVGVCVRCSSSLEEAM